MTLLALRATGLLATFNDAGVLALADVHVARRVALLGGEPDETVQLAVALTVRAVRLGSVCVELASVRSTTTTDEEVDVGALPWPEPPAWQAACERSPVVAASGESGRPLRLVRGLLYLDRYWRQEDSIRRHLQDRAAAPPPPVDVERLRADLEGLPGKQRLAAAVSALRWVSVLAGGPGTGKTTTIARLLAVLYAQASTPPRIALAAPTGKAAARLEEAVREVARELPGNPLPDLRASTLHRLLGRRAGSRTRFRHHSAHRLPYDVVVVDETSMVSLTLMARLIEAVRPDARLILVGDPDQLASVEAGAVLSDIVAADGLPEAALSHSLNSLGESCTVVNGVVTLDRVWRFGGAIAQLATAVRAGDDDAVVALLRSGSNELEFVESAPQSCAGLRSEVMAALETVADAASRGDAPAALEGLGRHRLLCAHRHGPYGVTRWTAEVESWLPTDSPVGRPVLITANDYDTGLYNGDTGVVIQTPDGPRAAFARGGDTMLIPPSRLSEAQTLYAMTVHRSQGSQFDRVSLILPPAGSPLLTRELFYTAVTRAQSGLRILGSEEAVRAAVTRPITRASGLRDSLGIPMDH
ncbi:exodeoxyribonuclease V subunit alpha [Actinoplanes sp. M2I2]|uniref:exodeoxyribonuclease V subunit alpha n=1 Tax=Actinoplanes sp. M2I2 TaxID=1734444 RepID=UPI0020217FDF|nr:exodeoxyribonuclease V subunit alpha [Actinoplanes sp. M2I2]